MTRAERAADLWGAPMRPVAVPPGPAGTHEHLLSQAVPPSSLLVFPDERRSPGAVPGTAAFLLDQATSRTRPLRGANSARRP